jgi:hypothetical protein
VWQDAFGVEGGHPRVQGASQEHHDALQEVDALLKQSPQPKGSFCL